MHMSASEALEKLYELTAGMPGMEGLPDAMRNPDPSQARYWGEVLGRNALGNVHYTKEAMESLLAGPMAWAPVDGGRRTLEFCKGFEKAVKQCNASRHAAFPADGGRFSAYGRDKLIATDLEGLSPLELAQWSYAAARNGLTPVDLAYDASFMEGSPHIKQPSDPRIYVGPVIRAQVHGFQGADFVWECYLAALR